ncbi:MAG: LysR family transcriptional regulator, partial [Oscillospiraceae bacterium]|nr:LysR family transcriptional regulator [Oscillospiraceae bacterium]
MDIGRIEEFAVLVQQGSFRLAAEELGISPALLSNHINLLEKRLGTKLLERSAHSLRLTEEGKRFLAEAKELSQEYRQMIDSIGSISESGSI